MGTQLKDFIERLSTVEPIWYILWFGLVALTLILLLLTRTRWGQSRALEKCVFLSLLAHLLFAGYAATVNIVSAVAASDEQSIELTAFSPDEFVDTKQSSPTNPKPWDTFIGQSVEVPIKKTLTPNVSLQKKSSDRLRDPNPLRGAPNNSALPPVERVAHQTEKTDPNFPDRATQSRLDEAAIEHTKPQEKKKQSNDLTPPPLISKKIAQRPNKKRREQQPIDNQRSQNPLVEIKINKPKASLPEIDSLSGLRLDGHQRVSKKTPSETASKIATGSSPVAKLPDVYQMRVAPNRDKIAKKLGATKETEAAVKLALKWFAANQSDDGRWDADKLEGGNERLILGHNRKAAGANADTGITGLVLLAYLGAGHTHLEGEYREEVRAGLNYLLRSQAKNGNLFGNARTFAKMYCHGMASFALSEAYAMSGDKRLKPSVLAAIKYTIMAQHPTGGGWRYQPGDLGDMSQLGWQVMAIKSAELAGIEIPLKTKLGIRRFLKRVSSGKNGGLASYRPGQRASQTMTAEALSCRLFLGLQRDHPAVDEAMELINQHRPGVGKPNLYYWYYATLACHQVQGDVWKQWNRDLIKTLTSSQRTTGKLTGSWDPKTVWGGYGGRAYSTAMATLSLEVYYRFLPLYSTVSKAK